MASLAGPRHVDAFAERISDQAKISRDDAFGKFGLCRKSGAIAIRSLEKNNHEEILQTPSAG